ncbi:acyl-CoA thioesterase [Mammaliicoccus sciuri]|uniref:acyl-CoA thioesterase n=1 Tax=Mammaliicoccus sciuri TaxID=1296 RepID=UPI0021D0C960|nr:thioesterase family protein [Mammaliicoccus sciuri]UXV32545.1 acyl-CoA thioesterase [Mammaliicoccus sciuri]
MQERKLVAEKEIEVNVYDIDAMGIVSNIVYVRWFEDLRTAFINQYMTYSEMMKFNISPILMRTEADYKVPLTIHDKPVGRCWLVKASRMKWELEFEIATEDKVHCTGYQKGGFYNVVDEKIAQTPKVFLEI